MIDRVWAILADLCVPRWASGLTTMPTHDRLAVMEHGVQHARLTGFRRLRIVR